MSNENEKLEAHARFVEGLAAQFGGSAATASIHDFTASPLCCGTVKSIAVRANKPLPGVVPVDRNGRVSKSGQVGNWEFTLVTPEGADVTVIPFSASMKAQLKAAAGGQWEFPATPLDAESLEASAKPPFEGVNLAFLFVGIWTEGDKSGDRFRLLQFESREKLVEFHSAYTDEMRRRRAEARRPVMKLLDDGNTAGE